MHMPQRGSIHSVFNAAVNIVFPGIPQGTRKGYPYHTTPIPGIPQGTRKGYPYHTTPIPGIPQGTRKGYPYHTTPAFRFRPCVSACPSSSAHSACISKP